MEREEKEELLRQRLTNLKGNLEVAQSCINSALENLNNLDDFNDLVNNWENYKDLFNKE